MGAQQSKETSTLNEKMTIKEDNTSSDVPMLQCALDSLHLGGDETGYSDPELSDHLLSQYSKDFWQDTKNQLAMNVTADHDPTDVIVNARNATKDRHVFNVKLDLEGAITNQKQSGRCWLFAGTNVLRIAVIKKFKLRDDFELSQSYLFFYDKLEKANWFLENMIDLADRDINDRVVQYLLQSPVGDGGQWDMFVNVVQKYGIVPKSVFPETHASSSSGRLNWLVTVKLREYAARLRSLIQQGATLSKIRSVKVGMMAEVYRILVIFLGEPPQSFDWEVMNKDDKCVSMTGLSPKKFAKEVVGYNLENTMSLINDPRNKFSRLYTVDRLGNVVGGSPIRYVNSTAQTMKTLAIQTLKAGRPVWFGCDVGQFNSRKHGAMDLHIYDYHVAYDLDFKLTKEQRLLYGESLMTHAMVFTGVHLDQKGDPVRWRVENSWGPDSGDNGYWVMGDDWFTEFVYQVVLEKTSVPKKLVDVLQTEPIVLPAYDPMGALA